MSKEEKIQEAYELLGFIWTRIERYVDKSNGIFNPTHSGYRLESEGMQDIKRMRTLKQRPLSLKGIEDNNGWIKIESESDLPKGYTDCDTCNINEYIGRANLKSDKNTISYCKRMGITHYQPIQKPQPPIY